MAALRPSERHLLLLHAALDEPRQALESWERWRRAVDFDDIDSAENRLVPLAYSNLGRAIEDDSAYGRAAGLYRHAWSRNQVLFGRSEGALAALGDAGIDAMLLRASALARCCYENSGERPIEAVDILVRPARARAAVETLRGAGWSIAREIDAEMVRLPWADLQDRSGGRVSLHWFSLWASTNDDKLWNEARPAPGGGRALAPSPADLLLLVCTEACSPQAGPQAGWVADALTVARTSEIDWDRLLAESVRRNLTTTMGAALAHLREEFGLEVPNPVLDGLADHRVPGWERREFRVQTAEPGPARTLLMLRARHRRMRMLRDEAPWHPGFIRYAQSFWDLDTPWKLPVHAARRVAGRTAERLGSTSRTGSRSSTLP